MQRSAMHFLNEWFISTSRKPLVIRGARQVGKTWLVRDFTRIHNLKLIELNLEDNPQLATYFSSNDPVQIIRNLEGALGVSINLSEYLLFIDEIQVAPELLAKLRWFAEKMPELPVIAAGSLLEFALTKHTLSMPVGRINFMYLEPLSFDEFLNAADNAQLSNYIKTYNWSNEIPQALHDKIMLLFKEYILVGGMPAAVAKWLEKHSFYEVSQIHHDLIATYRTDFAKYSKRILPEKLDAVLLAIPSTLGEKFMYSKIDPRASVQVKRALELLDTARVCHRVLSCAANGVPLGAEINQKFLKVILIDVGLCSALLKLSIDQLINIEELDLVNKGGIAEQAVGQLLRTLQPYFIEPALYYWQRMNPGSDAEVDYIIQHQNTVVPLEVKAGKTGRLKSLHVFMGLKKYPIAVRVNSALPSLNDVHIKDFEGNPMTYKLASLPFYLIGEIHRLIHEIQ